MNRIILFYLTIFDAILLTGLLIYFAMPWYIVLIPLLIFLIFTALASSNIQWNIFVPSINRGKTTGNAIALTFDDGPHPVYTPMVLDILKRNQAKASFFLIGKNAQQYPFLVERIIQEGHTIGNHSFHHSNSIGFNGKSTWVKELEETNKILRQIAGKTPRFFRPPFGITTPHLRMALKEVPMLSIGWSDRTFDTAIKDIGQINQKLERNVQAGSIILLHDRHENIAPLLEQLLPMLARKNFSFLTLNELIDEKPYLEI